MHDYQDYGWSTPETEAHGYLLPALLRLLGPRRDRTILDLGCGSGFLARQLLAHGFNVYGVDASESGIELASRGHEGRFFVIDPSMRQLPDALVEVPFDTIVSTEVIEHLYDPAEFIQFCQSVLPTGGELILSTPYHGYLKNLGLAIFGAWDKHHTAHWRGGHIKFWSRATLTTLLVNGGFSVERFLGCGRAPYLWKSMFMSARSKGSPQAAVGGLQAPPY